MAGTTAPGAAPTGDGVCAYEVCASMGRAPQSILNAAPIWARWIAQDRDGAWWAFEAEPNLGDLAWYENEVGRYVRLGMGAPNTLWHKALYRLPDDLQA